MPTLSHLDLGDCHTGNASITAFCAVAASLRCLQHLAWSGGYDNDAWLDAVHASRALSVLCSLTHLSFDALWDSDQFDQLVPGLHCLMCLQIVHFKCHRKGRVAPAGVVNFIEAAPALVELLLCSDVFDTQAKAQVDAAASMPGCMCDVCWL